MGQCLASSNFNEEWVGKLEKLIKKNVHYIRNIIKEKFLPFLNWQYFYRIRPLPLELPIMTEIPPALRHRIGIFLDYLATVELCSDLAVPFCINLRRRIVMRHGELQTALAALNLEWTHPIRVQLRRLHLEFHRRLVQIGQARRNRRMMLAVAEGNEDEEE